MTPKDYTTLSTPQAPQRLGRRFWHFLLEVLIRLLVRLDVQGQERLPATGPVILYFNHIHYVDPFVIIGLLRKVRYTVPLAKIELAHGPIIGKMVQWFGTVFVERGEVDMAALRAGLAVLEAGYVYMISPEGTRNKITHSLQPAQRGMGLLVRRTQATLLPVAIWGTPDFPGAYRKGHRPTIHIRYGRPFKMHVPADVDRRTAESEITSYAMQELAALLPKQMQGVYAPPQQPHPWAEYLGRGV